MSDEYGLNYRRHAGQASLGCHQALTGRPSAADRRQQLAEVQAEVQAKMERWLQQTRRTGGYPPFDDVRPAPKSQPYTGYQYRWDGGDGDTAWHEYGEEEMLTFLRHYRLDVASYTARMKAGRILRTSDGALYRWVENWLPDTEVQR